MTKKIGFVHPPVNAFFSGGNVYNEKLLEFARHSRYPLVSTPQRGEKLACRNWDLLVWDGLYLDRLTRIADERIAVLLHYLPSLDPGLDLSERLKVRNMERHALAQADCVIVTGRPVKDAVLKCWPRKPVFLCEPGVGDAFSRQRRGAAHQHVKLITVAHLLPAKGHACLLEILEQFAHLRWHWHLAGDCVRSPATVQHLRHRAALAELTDRITYHGVLGPEAVATLMADSDFMVFPSTFESYGIVLAEAAAIGLPVISNRVGAAAQLIQHGTTGFLTTAGDWVSFGRYLQVLLEDATLRATFRSNISQVAVRGWDKTFIDFRAACEAILG